jgi:hypothetical protein
VKIIEKQPVSDYFRSIETKIFTRVKATDPKFPWITRCIRASHTEKWNETQDLLRAALGTVFPVFIEEGKDEESGIRFVSFPSSPWSYPIDMFYDPATPQEPQIGKFFIESVEYASWYQNAALYHTDGTAVPLGFDLGLQSVYPPGMKRVFNGLSTNGILHPNEIELWNVQMVVGPHTWTSSRYGGKAFCVPSVDHKGNLGLYSTEFVNGQTRGLFQFPIYDKRNIAIYAANILSLNQK